MSCNGCRVLRKGCSDACTLRPCLQWIESPEAQGHATVFVAKFFGRAGLMSFISAVPESQRAALFQSLLYEACGRTVNPVHGAVGLLWTGNWHICQAAVETVLKGGTVRPATSVPSGSSPLQYSAAMSLASIHRSTMASVPEAAAVLTLSSSEPSFPAARTFNEASRPNKRPLDESATAVDRNIACSSQERSDSKRYRTGEQDCDGAKLVRGVQQQPQPKNDPPSYPSLAAIWTPKPQFSTETTGAAEFSDLRKREQPRTGAGQLVAPVPIRVCPRLDDTEFHGLFRAGGGETPQRKSNVELDLTLNSIRSSSSRAKPGLVRVSSPSTISVNSEGSVTSLESADLSISPWPIRLTPSPELQEHKLLDLLL